MIHEINIKWDMEAKELSMTNPDDAIITIGMLEYALDLQKHRRMIAHTARSNMRDMQKYITDLENRNE